MATLILNGGGDGLRDEHSHLQNSTNHTNFIRRDVQVQVVQPTHEVKEERTVIQKFYSGASVLVTGATGFMGKVLIEKLLRSCPDIDSVYIMVREKKGRSLDERIEDLISAPCFSRLKTEVPDFRTKLHVVSGDIGLEGLGISDSDKHLLAQQVSVVFHVAATVRFDEHLQLAILQNVRGTRELLNLSRTFRNLKSIVHVSTAYSNCPQMQIDERFYDPHLASDHAIHMAESLDIDTIDHLSHKLMGEWPNTYSFTKAMSEDVVRTCGRGLPIAVFRPSIVVATKSEPMVGWIDNLYGPTGVIIASAAGLLRTMQTNDETEANIVPCDMVINALIVSAWDVAENRSTEEMPFYNYVSPRSNRITWRRSTFLYKDQGTRVPLARALWYPTIFLITSKPLYLFVRLLVHFLPALLMDICLLATNKSPRMLKIYLKLHKFTSVITYFSTKEWKFENTNVECMWNRLQEKDRNIFHFDMNSLDWYRYIQDTCIGLRIYLVKDPVETLPSARTRWQRLQLLHRAVKLVVRVFIVWLLIQFLSLLWDTLRIAAENWSVGDFLFGVD